MQHVNGIIELRYIQHSECSCGIANPNFADASANRIHRLPVGYQVLDASDLFSDRAVMPNEPA
jgi:hypothetical protein